MGKCCKEYEDILIDIYYGELEISTGIKAHLENCSNCREFLSEMEELKVDLNHLEMDLSVDDSLIRNAFAFADEKAAKKRKTVDLSIFLSIAFVIMAFIFIFALKGYGKYLLYGQGLIFFLAPFSLLAFVRGRRLKEDM
jgi:predicted anti-sigma-YlaC factor YlaD